MASHRAGRSLASVSLRRLEHLVAPPDHPSPAAPDREERAAALGWVRHTFRTGAAVVHPAREEGGTAPMAPPNCLLRLVYSISLNFDPTYCLCGHVGYIYCCVNNIP